VEMERVRMPMAMRLLLVAIAMQVVLDVAALVVPGANVEPVSAIVALSIDLVVLAVLARGNEIARSLVRLAAGLGMAIDGGLLIATIVWAPRDTEGLVAIGAAALVLATSTLAFMILGRHDVMTWSFDRWLAVHDPD
jgi:hypothetical protein